MRSHPSEQALLVVRALKRYVNNFIEQGETPIIFYKPLKREVPKQKVAGHGYKIPGHPGLETLARNIQTCSKCSLAGTRKKVVFGEGDPEASLVFVGEAPGADEDREGKPFVGAAGKLLTRIIESIGLKREQVYICNILKCRPPGNRNPKPEEIAACQPYLIKQLEMLRPRLICALGSFAAQTLLDSKEPIGRLRGKIYTYHAIPLVPTFHPAALLYHPQNKRPVWEDMKKIAGILELKQISPKA
ncbi:uracil-DNA glycosylase [bacterium]|nr:uracil-DNA glycosylase [bacterium]